MPEKSHKKRPFTLLWILLAVALAAVFALSCLDVIPSFFGYSPKSSGMAKALFPDNKPVEMAADTVVADTVTEPVKFEPDTAAHTILFIGDSMLDGLSPRLAAYAKASGHTLYSVVWYSSSTEIWGRSHRLAEYIQRISPTYIFICLGANELYVQDIAEKRTPVIREMLAEIDTIPYIWIGPPNWVEDTGINKMIADNTAPGTYFKSDGMTFQRRSDGAHPTAKSAIEWMDSVVRWMPDNCAHPIRMTSPTESTARPERIFIHQPGEN